jgi:hypothetical protein
VYSSDLILTRTFAISITVFKLWACEHYQDRIIIICFPSFTLTIYYNITYGIPSKTYKFEQFYRFCETAQWDGPYNADNNAMQNISAGDKAVTWKTQSKRPYL